LDHLRLCLLQELASKGGDLRRWTILVDQDWNILGQDELLLRKHHLATGGGLLAQNAAIDVLLELTETIFAVDLHS
jgi:hypothetical protein